MKNNKLLPIWVAIIAGFLGLVGNFYNGLKSVEIEKKQFESNLILKYLDPNDSSRSIKNIQFLIKAGLISADNDKIVNTIKDPTYKIETPKPVDVNQGHTNNNIGLNYPVFSSKVVDENKIPISGASIKITGDNGSSNANSDVNGVFKIGIPEGRWIIVQIIKPGYVPINKKYIKKLFMNVTPLILNKAK